MFVLIDVVACTASGHVSNSEHIKIYMCIKMFNLFNPHVWFLRHYKDKDFFLICIVPYTNIFFLPSVSLLYTLL